MNSGRGWAVTMIMSLGVGPVAAQAPGATRDAALRTQIQPKQQSEEPGKPAWDRGNLHSDRYLVARGEVRPCKAIAGAGASRTV